MISSQKNINQRNTRVCPKAPISESCSWAVVVQISTIGWNSWPSFFGNNNLWSQGTLIKLHWLPWSPTTWVKDRYGPCTSFRNKLPGISSSNGVQKWYTLAVFVEKGIYLDDQDFFQKKKSPNQCSSGFLRNELVVSTHLKNMLVKMGSSSPIFGVKIKNVIWKPPPREELQNPETNLYNVYRTFSALRPLPRPFQDLDLLRWTASEAPGSSPILGGSSHLVSG